VAVKTKVISAVSVCYKNDIQNCDVVTKPVESSILCWLSSTVKCLHFALTYVRLKSLSTAQHQLVDCDILATPLRWCFTHFQCLQISSDISTSF